MQPDRSAAFVDCPACAEENGGWRCTQGDGCIIEEAFGPTDSEKRRQEASSAASTQCEANVWVRPGYWHKFQCKRKATTEVDRLPLCTQHAKLAEQRGIRYVQ